MMLRVGGGEKAVGGRKWFTAETHATPLMLAS